jgi:hypothetical protein
MVGITSHTLPNYVSQGFVNMVKADTACLLPRGDLLTPELSIDLFDSWSDDY